MTHSEVEVQALEAMYCRKMTQLLQTAIEDGNKKQQQEGADGRPEAEQPRH